MDVAQQARTAEGRTSTSSTDHPCSIATVPLPSEEPACSSVATAGRAVMPIDVLGLTRLGVNSGCTPVSRTSTGTTTSAAAAAIRMYVCMYVITFMFAQQLSLDCHGGAIVNHKLYRIFQSSIEHRTESVRSMGHELSVAMSSV